MNYKDGDIALMILSTGENIMGTIVKINQQLQTVELDNVCYIVPDQKGQVNPVPYLMFSKETTATFESNHVRHYLTPTDEILKWYSSIYTVLDLPPERKIIT